MHRRFDPSVPSILHVTILATTGYDHQAELVRITTQRKDGRALMNEIKLAKPDFPILDCIAQRWSPYLFAPRGVEPEKLRSCLEAARWAASSFNEQPWSFILARREQTVEFQRVLGCLVESNQAWAKNAGVLMLSVVAKSFSRNGTPNRVAQHDLGLAMGNLCCQATHLGLFVHQMAGVNLDQVRQEFAIPDTHDPHTGIAIGYAEPPAQASNQTFAERDSAPRPRKRLNEFVFSGKWSQPAQL
jgi:nitroreductase